MSNKSLIIPWSSCSLLRVFSASSIDEYRGTDVYLARAGYLRRIAVLPTGFGQGVYAAVAYEVGDAWSAQTHTTLRQDGLAGVVAATPLGGITVAGSGCDAGRRKILVKRRPAILRP